jgi:hypothetical protein
MLARFADACSRLIRSRVALSLILVIAFVVVSGLYVQWRHSRTPRSAVAAEPDTMCLASKIGLPCRP